MPDKAPKVTAEMVKRLREILAELRGYAEHLSEDGDDDGSQEVSKQYTADADAIEAVLLERDKLAADVETLRGALEASRGILPNTSSEVDALVDAALAATEPGKRPTQGVRVEHKTITMPAEDVLKATEGKVEG